MVRDDRAISKRGLEREEEKNGGKSSEKAVIRSSVQERKSRGYTTYLDEVKADWDRTRPGCSRDEFVVLR